LWYRCLSIFKLIPPVRTRILEDQDPSLGTHRYDALIVDNNMPFNTLRVGDLIVFHPTAQHTTVISKVTQIATDSNSGENIVRTQNNVNPVLQQNCIGKVVYIIQRLGVGIDSTLAHGVGSSRTPSPISASVDDHLWDCNWHYDYNGVMNGGSECY
jgi:hypothetical protein